MQAHSGNLAARTAPIKTRFDARDEARMALTRCRGGKCISQ